MDRAYVQQAKQREKPTPEVFRVQHFIVNSYLIGKPGGEWVLVDAGLTRNSAGKILKTAKKVFGRGSVPSAIILTHGHFDHVGAVSELANLWQVPVYAHPMELPYLTGQSEYPPADPTVGGGLMARMAGMYPNRPINLGANAHALPQDHSVPGIPGWRWIHTPGHTPGHVSLFRDSDRTLIAGDAFVTVNQESALAQITKAQQVHRPPAYFTTDWTAARASVLTLANLEPEYAAAGHGIPMYGLELRRQLRDLAERFNELALPERGRYVYQPVLADERGVISLPAPVTDPMPKMVAGASIAAVAAVSALMFLRHRRRRLPQET